MFIFRLSLYFYWTKRFNCYAQCNQIPRNSRSQCCSWLITAKETLQILLSFSRLTVPQCNFASLTIYNGRNDTSFVLGNYCGENATAGIKVLSSKNHLFLVTNFWSYGSHPKKVFTFRAKYYATQLEGLILIFSNYFLCNWHCKCDRVIRDFQIEIFFKF